MGHVRKTNQQPGDRYQRCGALSGRLPNQTTNGHGIVPVGSSRIARRFPLALYFENSILTSDLPLLASAAASVNKIEQDGGVWWWIHLKAWASPGKACLGERPIVASAGRGYAVAAIWDRRGGARSEKIKYANPGFQRRTAIGQRVGFGRHFSYQSSARAMAVLSARPAKIEIDGASVQQDCPPVGSGFLLTLPRGQHLVQVEAAASHR
jgi:hypothetical protein